MSFTEYDIDSLGEVLAREGLATAHTRVLLRAFYEGAGKIDFSTLKVGRRVEEWFGQAGVPVRSTVRHRVRSADGTLKLLIAFSDGQTVESVLMPGYRPDRAAGCISSQVGCAMGCDFCASTKSGLQRNLTCPEIVEQFLHLKSEALQLDRRLQSLVFMGMGEPMHNLDNVIAAIKRIADPDLGGLGWRQVTVSTVGIVPGIDRLAEADLNVHLALSLHAPDDATRARLVPANRRYPIAEIMDAAKRFVAKTRRIPTIEYCLLANVNDSDAHAHALADLMTGFRAHVNLIPYNAIGAGLSGAVYSRPAPAQIAAFLDILRARKIVAHPRDTRGDDVSAACGQLRQTALNAVGADPRVRP
ncbi:MAG TPA: 23S rRNA (adenine(2503)-C(2))-methyltransferase RlmN [Tepidisphaeraceae bacterium]|jgi:23S rRNA (adenine2503-C2)-methyltransferase